MTDRAFKNFTRYFISGAGIILGMAIIMVILGMIAGGRSVLYDSFWSKGVKVYDIEIKNKELDAEGYLRPEDGKLLKNKMPEVKESIPVLRLTGSLDSYKASGNALTLAVNERFLQYANLEMLEGSFINRGDVRNANKIAVIDDLTALELFGTIDITGQKLGLEVRGKRVELLVAGVFKNFNKNIETLFEEEIEGLCLIPDSVPLDASFDFSMEKLIALVDKDLHEEEAAARLGHLLEKEHGVTEMYGINEYNQLSKVSEFADKYLVFAVIIALTGLISGGIGVMNAMLLTIEERKKEIGLYKFYGTRIRELQYDIIYTALIICNGSGILGFILGIIAGNFIGSFINIRAGAAFMSIFITITASTIIGIICSLYPASRIKQVDVSEAIWGE